jgi:DNA-binding beta-propeller fold protein YncE
MYKRLVFAIAIAVSLATTASAQGTGELAQHGGSKSCFNFRARKHGCQPARGVRFAESIGVSPDGRNVYVLSYAGSAVASFVRNPRTGRLSQLPGKQGCIVVERPDQEGCAQARGLEEPEDIAISPDGKSVYMVGFDSNSVAVFDRDPRTGALHQKPGKAGCIAEGGEDGCAETDSILIPVAVEVSPDGRNVYVASRGEEDHESPHPKLVPTARSVSIFDRDPASGRLSQKPGVAGCISGSEGGGACSFEPALGEPDGIATSPDGNFVFVSYGSPSYSKSRVPGGVTAFRRDASGALSRVPGTAGCVAEGGAGGCQSGRKVGEPYGIVVSPDSHTLFVSSIVGISVYAVGPAGELSSKQCFARAAGGGCGKLRGVFGSRDLAVSPDGKNLYAAGIAISGVVAYDLAADGRLRQKRTAAGCISERPKAHRCLLGRGLEGASGVIVSPDGRNVYVASSSGGVVGLDRARGRPQAATIRPGCLSSAPPRSTMTGSWAATPSRWPARWSTQRASSRGCARSTSAAARAG